MICLHFLLCFRAYEPYLLWTVPSVTTLVLRFSSCLCTYIPKSYWLLNCSALRSVSSTETSSLLWLLLRVCPSEARVLLIVRCYYRFPLPMRPPRVSVITFTSYICCIYALKFGQYWTSFSIGNSSVSSTPSIQFLFVRPRFCRRLPSDSASRRTPLPASRIPDNPRDNLLVPASISGFPLPYLSISMVPILYIWFATSNASQIAYIILETFFASPMV